MPTLLANNINLYYEIHGQGQPLVFIHGLGSSTQDWENQVTFFSQYYQVITFDLRGHGQSDKPDEHYTVPLFASDATQLIRAISQQPVHLVGHSLGGMVAFQLILDAPELVKSLTILNSAPSVTFPSLRSRILFYLRTLNVRFFGMYLLSHQLAKLVFPYPTQAQLRTKFIERWMKNDPIAYAHSLHAFSHWDVSKRLSEIKCPTLIVGAEHDYTPIAYKQLYTRLIPNAELVMIPNSFHMTLLDQPDAFNKVLFDFLNKHFSAQ